MRHFDWNDLRYFLELVRSGTPSNAARRLRADHTTVRRRIAALEEALQTKLFHAGESGHELTLQGDVLLRYAEAIEGFTLAVESEISDKNIALSGAVRVGAPDGFGSAFLAPRLWRLTEQHPELQIQLIAMPRVFNLSKREADLAIGFSPPNQQRQVVRKLTDYRLALYASRSYLETHPPITALADLREHRMVAYIQELLYTPEIDYVPQLGEPVRTQFESADIIAQFNATIAGAGVAILPCFIAQSHPELRPVLHDVFTLQRQFWLIVHPDMRNLARVRAVCDFIAEQVGAAKDLFMGEPEVDRPDKVRSSAG